MSNDTIPIPYKHAEAFALMRYQSDDGQEVEYIWNSRDGVTPFVITSRLGTELTHTDWHLDQQIPNFRPQPGSRIFVDLTEDRAMKIAAARFEQMWPRYQEVHPDMTREQVLWDIFYDLHKPGTPDLIEVEQEARTLP